MVPIRALILCLVLLAGCRNDAITYAKLLWPKARCSAVNTTGWFNNRNNDTAVCVVGGDVYSCSAEGGPNQEPSCVKKGTVQIEAP